MSIYNLKLPFSLQCQLEAFLQTELSDIDPFIDPEVIMSEDQTMTGVNNDYGVPGYDRLKSGENFVFDDKVEKLL